MIKSYSTFITLTCGLAFDHTLPISLKLHLIAGYMRTIRPYPSSMYTAASPLKLSVRGRLNTGFRVRQPLVKYRHSKGLPLQKKDYTSMQYC